MSTAKVVEFRSLVDQLDDAEYNKMISRFIKRCPRVLVILWLFKQFMQGKDKSFDQRLLNNAIGDCSNIIESRESNQNEDEADNKTIGESLSGDLYREIASYLEQKEYFKFSQTNRAIYIGCNSPNSLRHLDLIKVKKYSSIHLTKYPQLMHLKIDLTRFHKLKLPTDGSTFCNHLNELTLHGREKVNIGAYADAFINNQSFNFERLQQLHLSNLGKKGFNIFAFNVDRFRRLLSKFSQIFSLSLIGFYCPTSSIEDQTMLSLLPNICKLKMNGVERVTMSQFIRLYGEKLTSLTINDRSDYTLPDIFFSNLRHLSVAGKSRTPSNMDTILKSAKMLKEVQIVDKGRSRISADNKDWEKRVNDILSQQKYLEYFGIQTNIGNLVHIANGFESGLYATDHITNDISIHLHLKSGSLDSRKTFIYVSRILEKLAISKRENFMLICRLGEKRGVNTDKTWGEEVKRFCTRYADLYQTLTYIAERWVVVANKSCHISGCRTDLLLRNW